jgi:hypothetical protein
MMKKNERIDRNNTMHSNVEPGTIDMFKSTNPRVRREAERFLETIRDPRTRYEEEIPNNYDEIHDIKQNMRTKSIDVNGITGRMGSLSVPKARDGLQLDTLKNTRKFEEEN